MSDATIISIVNCVVTVVTVVTGLLSLWVKLKYSVEKTEQAVMKTEEVGRKVDDNTALTTEVKASADRASQHVEGCDERTKALNNKLADHDNRIRDVEAKLTAVQSTAEVLGKNIDSTRHELRSDLQALMNKLDIVVMKSAEMAGVVSASTRPAPKGD